MNAFLGENEMEIYVGDYWASINGSLVTRGSKFNKFGNNFIQNVETIKFTK